MILPGCNRPLYRLAPGPWRQIRHHRAHVALFLQACRASTFAATPSPKRMFWGF